MQKPRSRPSIVQATAALLLIASGVSAAHADVNFQATFSESGQNVFGSGSAIVFDTGTQRLGPDPFNLGQTVGGFVDPCPFISCKTGAEVGADINGNIGLEYGVKVNSGSVDVKYPVNVHIGLPSAPVVAGQNFTITTGYSIPGYGASPTSILGTNIVATMQTHSPTLQAFVDLDAQFHAFAGAEACVAGICLGPAIGPLDADGSRTLAAINRNGDGQLILGDDKVNLDQNFTTLGGDVTGRLNIPNIDARSTTVNGSTATDLLTYGRDNILAVDANVGNLVSEALGFPLAGDFGGIGYNLLSANAGLALDLQQQLSLTVTPMETFNFLSPVRQVMSDGTLGAYTKSITTALGQSITLQSNAQSVAMVPVTSLVATLSDTTSLVVQGDASVQALAANVFGLNIGPLLDSGNGDTDLFSIPLVQDSFNVPFQTVSGTPFNYVQATNFGLSDPGYRVYVQPTGTDQDNPGLKTGEVEAVDLGCAALLACPATAIGPSSLYALDSDGDVVYVDSASDLVMPDNNPGEVGSDQTQLDLLDATGYDSQYVSFVAPEGEPLPTTIPEPSTWVLLLVGLGMVARRRLGGAKRYPTSRSDLLQDEHPQNVGLRFA